MIILLLVVIVYSIKLCWKAKDSGFVLGCMKGKDGIVRRVFVAFLGPDY